ncbi:MAG: PKD domain-containing protein, partial [Flavobacteriales bacterium]|nr:PKD domain-containing protein [Flavobacteriales bacterium]
SSSTNGQVDNLITPYLDLTSTTTPITLSFSVANARYNSNFYDSLIVYISTNCGGTWSHLAAYGNNTGPSPLATAPDVTSLFTPTNSQWATKTINLNAYASMSAVQIRFQLRSGWGNVTYLDDINIAGGAVPPPVASFSSSSNTICAGQNINFTNTSTGATSYSWSMPGGTPSSSTATNPSVVYNSAGTYTVTLTATNNSGTSTSTATFTVKANPNAVATNNGAICQGSSATLTAVGGGTYSWSNGSTSATTNVSPIVNTSYTVTVTASNGCTATSSTTVTVLDCSSIDDVLQADNMLFFPNPAHTTIQLDLSSVSNETLTVDWLTPIGQLMQTYFIQPYQTSIVMHVDHLAAGIYLVRITDGTRSITRRIMIIK